MPAWLLALIGFGALLPVASGEPSLKFLPERKVGEVAGGSLLSSLYTWHGDLVGDLPQYEEELVRHGFQGRLCFEGNNWGATFTRKDGVKVRLSWGRWAFDGRAGYQVDANDHDCVSARIDEPIRSVALWRQLVLHLHR
ncbi:hypothetical protein OP10G_4418 [Fimbriimonas ginsengisoli Gsoil 348]|uniref:Uncharacterized protein n=2 Tax=Fimbriimonas ginsengisoli TaxID=1005039 RepID=A0A068NWF5_FIMGI|nr:hypothetical protein OP10G_4418 [Fimbriimonas ginsengisoli Gsoil 348]